MTSPIEKLREYGYELPAPKAPVASYVSVARSGNILYVSGQISAEANGVVTGLLGDNMNVVQGGNAAELAAVNILSQVVHIGGVPLEDIKRVLKVTVLVASTPEFTEQHLVANGCSNLLVGVLGDKGKHARAAFGVVSLPFGAAVEIDAVIEV
ncbi:RidA family protein [Devosia sp. 2618]|uniref:RidA family protein n=1 Tax=Devosia sp. 2618 TaxID=3156454 RepID=UPI003393634B